MKDIINQKLLRALRKNSTDTQLLQRYFRIRFRISIGEDALNLRMQNLRKGFTV